MTLLYSYVLFINICSDNEDIYNFNSSRNTAGSIKSKRFRRKGDVASKDLDKHKILIGKSENKLPAGSSLTF